MKKILVPTDFSACADNAVDFAVQSAKLLSAELILFHAFEMKNIAYTDYTGGDKELNKALLDDAHDKLVEMKRAIEEAERVTVQTYVSVNPVTDALLQAAGELDVDFIVMGTRGAGFLKEKLWGSKTAAMIGKTKVPLIVIPTDYEWKKPEKLLLATNHFENEPVIMDFLFELADLFMVQVHVAVMTDEDDDKAVTFLEHTRRLQRFEKILKEQYNEPTLTGTHLYGKDFETTLQEHIDAQGIDMLAMVTYQRGFWDRIFHPSMTKKMSYHTEVPLLVIPAVRA
jgi:nucleotide-binding universal stress UspA family protein